MLKLISVGALLLTPSLLFCASGIVAPDVTVGHNLQMYVTVKLPQPAPPEGLQLTVTSDDPKRALVSKSVDKAGSASIELLVLKGLRNSPEFFIQGLADQGTVTYTVTAPGLDNAKGTVTLAPSTVAILAPSRQSAIKTTPRGPGARLTLVTASLDSSMKVAEEQQVAGGSSIRVSIANTRPETGSVGESAFTIKGSESIAMTMFQPAAVGESELSLLLPPGFRASSNYSKIAINIQAPGIAVADPLTIGKDLQMPGFVCLGDPAGPAGLKVTLTSRDPSKLLLSTAEDKPGAASITLDVKPGAGTAQYFMQSLVDAGNVDYDASAPGYRPRVGHAAFAPSGFIVAYSAYVPPDEAAVLRQTGTHEERSFYTSVGDPKTNPSRLMVWSAYLDHGLAADITVQGLRPGVSATVNLTSSDQTIATVESPVKILSGSNEGSSLFTALKPGKAVITVDTPSGFSRPKNAVYVPAFVVN